MYDEQQVLNNIFLVFYGGVVVMGIIAWCYLLLRRGNAFASDVTPPARLRRWTAAFFAAMTLSHVWYLPMYILPPSDDAYLSYLIGGLLDSMTVFPLAIVVLLVMLQDRRRPLWPVSMVMAPLTVAGAVCVATRSVTVLPYVYAYFLLACIAIIIYMIRATRQYGRWLRDNYADLEHKEVRQSVVMLGIMLLAFNVYIFEVGGQAFECVMQVIDAVVICYFLWRAETLNDLSLQDVSGSEVAAFSGSEVTSQQVTPEQSSPTHNLSGDEEEYSRAEATDAPLSVRNNIGPLLEQYCEASQLYLQNDISLTQLAKQIGVNRVYLSQHFASRGTTYNAYINGLRIRHFTILYQEATVDHRPITVQQLAYQSGFRSYGTFNTAFKQSMGMTATEWMRSLGS